MSPAFRRLNLKHQPPLGGTQNFFFMKKLFYKALRRFLAPAVLPEEEPFYLCDRARFAKYEVGEWSYGSPIIYEDRKEPDTTLKIGRYCSFGYGATFMLGGHHRIDWVTTYPFSIHFDEGVHFKGHPTSKGDIIIENDVWVGREALIMSGVRIGNGAVVAARSVVTKNVSPYEIVGGNPARHIKFRFSEDIITELEKIAWWNWDLEKIKEAFPLLLQSDIKAFIEKYK